MSTSIALIADNTKRSELLTLLTKYRSVFSSYRLLATAVTAQQIQAQSGLMVDCLRSESDGGDIQIAAQVLTGNVAAVIAFIDSWSSPPCESSLQILWRACEVQNIPFATNLATAELALRGFKRLRTAHLIFNPVAGQGNPDQDLGLICETLEPQMQLNIILTQPDINPADQAKDAIATIRANSTDDSPVTDLIIASGGDGTVSAVACATIGAGIPLGIIPRGTANAFSVALGIPTQLKGACETILKGNTRVVDAARCNDLPMILLAGIGFEAGMVEHADRALKDRLGTLAYVLSGVQQFVQQERFQAQIEVDGEVTELSTGAITIANAAPPGSVLAQGSGNVVPDDGLLEITIGATKDRIQSIAAMSSLLTAAIRKVPTNRDDILCLRTRRIKVTTNPPQKLVVDGEIIGTTPAEFECIPRGLTVFAPLSTV